MAYYNHGFQNVLNGQGGSNPGPVYSPYPRPSNNINGIEIPQQKELQQWQPQLQPPVRKTTVSKTTAPPLATSTVIKIVVGLLGALVIVGAVVAVVVVLVVVKSDSNQATETTATNVTATITNTATTNVATTTSASTTTTITTITTATARIPLYCNDSRYSFQCLKANLCLTPSQVCDRKNDCPDGSDEFNCNCTSDQHKCQEGKCLDNVFICDGVKDCPNADDEKLPLCVPCSAGQFRCRSNKTCLSDQKKCDGVVDCSDGSDEAVCLILAKSGEVKKVVGGGESLYACNVNMNASTAGLVCKIAGFKDFINFTSNPPPALAPSSYVSIESITDVDGVAVVNSKLVNQCGNILAMNCSEYGCGSRSEGRNYGQYIINGQRAVVGAWPWNAHLDAGDSSCGAVLISPNFVLTAAHCVVTEGVLSAVNTLSLSFGMVDSTDSNRQVLRVDKMKVHPEYDASKVVNDLALLKLKEKVTFTDNVRPICLPSRKTQQQPFYRVCVSVGFGMTEYNVTSDHLLQTRLNILPDQQCNTILGNEFIPENATLCVSSIPGLNRNNLCSGDSGGPLSCMDDNGKWSLVGIHSFVLTVDGKTYPESDYRFCQTGAVVNVVRYLPWIEDNMAAMMTA